MEETPLSVNDAADMYGIQTNHGKMPNGELRFRLISTDGNNYIRTAASLSGAWQEAHSHHSLRETYIVEKGWMAIAEEVDGQPVITLYWPQEVVTTKPKVVHNVYLPACAVIHTVKHGNAEFGDWQGSPEFTTKTSSYSEREVLINGVSKTYTSASDRRFEGYIALYNNLDNLIWRIPAFLAGGAAILIGFAGSVLSKDNVPDIPPILVVSIFFFVGLLFFLSWFSMTRIREHHTMAGEELARMEPDGYFHLRRETVKRAWPPSATLIFRLIYALLSLLFLALTAVALVKFSWLTELLQWKG